MNDYIFEIYGAHNDATFEGLMKAAEDIREEYGEEGVAVVEQILDETPAGDIFDEEMEAQKTASEDEDFSAQLVEADAQGRVIAHAIISELSRYEKTAEAARQYLVGRFQEVIGKAA